MGWIFGSGLRTRPQRSRRAKPRLAKRALLPVTLGFHTGLDQFDLLHAFRDAGANAVADRFREAVPGPVVPIVAAPARPDTGTPPCPGRPRCAESGPNQRSSVVLHADRPKVVAATTTIALKIVS
jgi:hypothetical protein